MKIFHIDRDYNKTLEQQKKELKSQYLNFQYLWTDNATGNAKIHFMSEGKLVETKETVTSQGITLTSADGYSVDYKINSHGSLVDEWEDNDKW